MLGCILRMICPGNSHIYIYTFTTSDGLETPHHMRLFRIDVKGLGVYWKWFWLRPLYLSQQRSCCSVFSVYLFLPDSNHKFVKTSNHPAIQHPNTDQSHPMSATLNHVSTHKLWNTRWWQLQFRCWQLHPCRRRGVRRGACSYKEVLGCPRKLGSMVSKWLIPPIYPIYK